MAAPSAHVAVRRERAERDGPRSPVRCRRLRALRHRQQIEGPFVRTHRDPTVCTPEGLAAQVLGGEGSPHSPWRALDCLLDRQPERRGQ